MKRCPKCKSVSPDSEATCGVCGGSLADVPYESNQEVERDQMADVREEERKERTIVRRIEKRRIVLTISAFIVGSGCLAGGIVLLGQFHNPYGLLVTLIGIGILGGVIGLPFPRGRSWYRR